MLSVGIESWAGASEVPFRRGDQDGPFEAKESERESGGMTPTCRTNVDFLDRTIKDIEKDKTFLHVLLQV